MIDWVFWKFGRIASLGFQLVVILASATWVWVAWRKLRREASAPQMHTRIEFTSVLAVTASVGLYAVFLLGIFVANLAPWGVSAHWDVWIFLGMGICGTALVLSLFCRSKLRLAGMIISALIAEFWWEVWRELESLRSLGNW